MFSIQVHLYPQLKGEILELLKKFHLLSQDLNPGPLALQSNTLPLCYQSLPGSIASFGQIVYAAIASRLECMHPRAHFN